METANTDTYLWARPTAITLASKMGPSIHCREDDIPVQSPSLLTPTPFFLRPLMLWKPINWLLSNCLSFRLCPCAGLSVQIHHPARGDAGNSRELSRSKAHICSQVGEVQPLQLQRLRHICESASSGHTVCVRYPKAAQRYPILYKWTFIKAASLFPPLVSYKPGGTGMWQSARPSAGHCCCVFSPDSDSAANWPVRRPLLIH